MQTKVHVQTKHERSIGTIAKATYFTPMLRRYGSISELTLGNNGSSIDGNNTMTQSGGGNDGSGPKVK